ncbi:MAG: YidC/Oxa1 family membrane protein insertase [Candidatus Beckwithbacteria bacterium]|nr:YidC/Oxa1 family membrane protein insertase [Patescibacteria group bacterium]
MWNTIFYQPLVNALIFFYQFLGQNLGLAIIGLTLFIRGALTPLTLPSLKSAKKLKELQPELAKLKKKYSKDSSAGVDKQQFAKEQLKFYKQHGVNPASGCLPQIVQIIILIALFQAFNQVLQPNGDMIESLNKILYQGLQLSKDFTLNTKFLYLDLTQPDLFVIKDIKFFNFTINRLPGLFLIAAAVTQFISSKLMMPAAKATQEKSKKTKEGSDDMAAAMQSQMLYMMPLMTIFIGFKFPSGLVLYWLTFSVFMLVQQLMLKKGS